MMIVHEYDNTLGPCPWCSAEKHIVRDDGLDIYGELDEDGEHRIYAQCEECSQISPSYPTIEKLREEWQALSQIPPWPICPKCNRPVVVTRGGEEGKETWFTFCCWDGPTRNSPQDAVSAFLAECDNYKGFFDFWCPRCCVGTDGYDYNLEQPKVGRDDEGNELCPVCDHKLVPFTER